YCIFFFFSSRRRHTRSKRDWSSDVCSSDLGDRIFTVRGAAGAHHTPPSRGRGGVADAPVSGNGLRARRVREHSEWCRGRFEQRQIGRASCRERVEGAVGGGGLE